MMSDHHHHHHYTFIVEGRQPKPKGQAHQDEIIMLGKGDNLVSSHAWHCLRSMGSLTMEVGPA